MSERETGPEAAALIRVEGLVQGVGFRRFVQREARAVKLAGFVENMKDGSARIFAQGRRGDIGKLVEKVKSAPRPVEVETLKVSGARLRPALRFFQIKSGPLSTEIQEGFGGMEAEFRDYREEFRDYRNEFRQFSGNTEENFQALGTKYGEISEKLTQILHELQTENRDSINSLNRSVEALLKAIERLSPPR